MKKECIAILYNIRSIYNVGSMFRTADGAGIAKLYLAGVTPAPVDRLGNYDTKFAKVSLGAERSVLWERVQSPRAIAKLIADLKKRGYLMCAVEQSRRSILYSDMDKVTSRKGKVALIFGNEIRGVPASILKQADNILEIPMRGAKESLNVSVAFGIIAYETIGK